MVDLYTVGVNILATMRFAIEEEFGSGIEFSFQITSVYGCLLLASASKLEKLGNQLNLYLINWGV